LDSLRVFQTDFGFVEENLTSSDGHLLFIEEISVRAPKLEYVGVYSYVCGELLCGKRVSGEWVLCDKADFRDAWSFPQVIYS
jgi:hypothetical protein